MDQQVQPWHQLFGLAWIDFFRGTDIQVDTEIDLSQRQQYLDLSVTRKPGAVLPAKMPDGFENLGTYNLTTFKSHRETLSWWALMELLGHFVNHRKQFSPSMDDLIHEDEFRLFAVCARFPQTLSETIPWMMICPGVYETVALTRTIRITDHSHHGG